MKIFPNYPERPNFQRIDSHHHFWRYRPEEFRWIDDNMEILQRDFMPDDWAPLLKQNKMDGCIVVQSRSLEEETRFLADLAKDYFWMAGVVGWLDLRAETVDDRLAFWGERPIVKGYRHQIQDERYPAVFMADADFNRGVEAVQKRDLIYEVLIHAKDLIAATEFCGRHDKAVLVLDHLGKPAVGQETAAEWSRRLAPLAEMEHVCCKLSGLVTEASWSLWSEAELMPYIETALELFGPSRIMFGSDWPVCLLAASLEQVYQLIENAVGRLSDSEQKAIWGGNARRIYNLDL